MDEAAFGRAEKRNSALPKPPPPHGDSYSKPQAALVMFPKLGKMSAVGRKIFNVLAKTMQEQVIQFKSTSDSEVPITHEFTMPLSELLAGIEAGKSNLFQQAKARLKAMQSIQLEYESPTVNGSLQDWGVMNLLSQAGIRHDPVTKLPYAYWQYPGPIYTALTTDGFYTILNNALIAELRTYAAVALYEICVKYKTSPGGATAKHEVSWWVDALSETPPKLDKKTGIAKPRDWAHFKDRQLKLAIEEINSKTDISIDVIDYKTGKKITHAQFIVVAKGNSKVDTSVRLSQELANKVNEIGLRIGDVLAIKKKGKSEIFLSMCLDKLRERLARQDLPQVTSRIAYLRSVVEDLESKVHQDSSDAMTARRSVLAAKEDIRVEVISTSSQQDNTILPIARTYQEERFEEIKALLLSESPDVQKKIALYSLSTLPTVMVTPLLQRKIESGQWMTSIPLANAMVKTFAIQTYGPNWHTETGIL